MRRRVSPSPAWAAPWPASAGSRPGRPLVEAGLAAMDTAGVTAADIGASWFGCTTVSANHALLNFSLSSATPP